MQIVMPMLAGSAKGVSNVPTLNPSEGEFEDMVRYVQSITSMGQEYGMVKVVPPSSWKARALGYDAVDSLVRSSGKQTSEGDDGVYWLMAEEFGGVYMSDFKKYIQHVDNTHHVDFWSTVGDNDSQEVYTAHSPNASLFDKDVMAWNLGKVDGLVKSRASRGWQVSSQGTNGVNLGMRNTARGWIREDTPSFGAAFLHFGEKRTVYSVPSSHHARVEEILNEMLPDKAQAMQGQPLTRLHALLLDPAVLSKRGVPVMKLVQEPGEFVVHFSGAYHCSFCHGLSCWEYGSISTAPTNEGTQRPSFPASRASPMGARPGLPVLQQELEHQQHNMQHQHQQLHHQAAAMQQIQLQQMMLAQQMQQPMMQVQQPPMVNLANLAAFAESVKQEPGLKEKPKPASAAKKRGGKEPVDKPMNGKRKAAEEPEEKRLMPRAARTASFGAQNEAMHHSSDDCARDNSKGQGIRRKRKRKQEDDMGPDGKGKLGDKKDLSTADKNKNCHFCEHAPKRCSIFACTDSVCDQMFCENCCKRHLGKPTHFKGQDDADACRWRCPICTRQCCCTLAVCNRQHLHCKRYRRKMKHVLRKGGSMGSDTLEEVPVSDAEDANEEEEEEEHDTHAHHPSTNSRRVETPENSQSHPAASHFMSRLPSTEAGLHFNMHEGMQGMVRGMQMHFQQTAYPVLMQNDLARAVSSPGLRFSHPLTPLFGVSTPTLQNAGSLVNTPGGYGVGGTPIGVGTPLTPLGDYPAVTTPFSFQAESHEDQQPANCSWFDTLFGASADVASLVQQQVLGQLQVQALNPAARQGFHPQAQQALQQWAAQQVALVSHNQQPAQKQAGGPQGTLEDTTSSWAPDEFVFSPQDEDE